MHWLSSTLTSKLRMGSISGTRSALLLNLSLEHDLSVSSTFLSQFRNNKKVVIMVKQTRAGSMSCVVHRPHTGVQGRYDTVAYIHKAYSKVKDTDS